MNSVFPFLSQRVFNTPLCIHPAKCEVALAALADRLGIARIVRADGSGPVAFEDDLGFSDQARDYVGYDVIGGVACIQVEGMLVQKTGSLRPWSGMTGWDGLRTNFLTALADPSVKAIAFDMNSGGGEVSGCFDFCDTVFAARGVKPIWAVLGDCAYSAAYSLASACDRVTVPRTGGTGSIGIIALLVDFSKAITASGLEVHFVRYGEQKARELREMHTGVSQELLDRLQVDIDAMGDLFVQTVARNRNMAPAAVRAQQADYYLGAAGVEAGLADAVMSPDEAFEELLASLD